MKKRFLASTLFLAAIFSSLQAGAVATDTTNASQSTDNPYIYLSQNEMFDEREELLNKYENAIETNNVAEQEEILNKADLLFEARKQQVENNSETIVPASTLPYSAYHESSVWVYRSDGWCLRVTPTNWFRSQGEQGHDVYGLDGFETLKARHSGESKWDNTDSMQYQYMCHYIWAIKTPWNLEPWKELADINKLTCN